jgi:hypothetical protein
LNLKSQFALHHFPRPIVRRGRIAIKTSGMSSWYRQIAFPLPQIGTGMGSLGDDDSGINLFGSGDTSLQADPFAYGGIDTGDYAPSIESGIELLPSENEATADLASQLGVQIGLPGSLAIGSDPSGLTITPSATPAPAAAPTAPGIWSQLASGLKSLFPPLPAGAKPQPGYTNIGGSQVPTSLLALGGGALALIVLLNVLGGKRRR